VDSTRTAWLPLGGGVRLSLTRLARQGPRDLSPNLVILQPTATIIAPATPLLGLPMTPPRRFSWLILGVFDLFRTAHQEIESPLGYEGQLTRLQVISILLWVVARRKCAVTAITW